MTNIAKDNNINLSKGLIQEEALECLIQSNFNGGLILPTGSGKTKIIVDALNLLYKEKYDLQIREEDEVFVVDLRVELAKIENREQVDALKQSQSNFAYA